MARPFHKLRMRLLEFDYTQEDVARKTRLGRASVSARLNARKPWTLDEMYDILDMIGEPPSRMHEYFPRNGQNEPGCRRGRKEA